MSGSHATWCTPWRNTLEITTKEMDTESMVWNDLTRIACCNVLVRKIRLKLMQLIRILDRLASESLSQGYSQPY